MELSQCSKSIFFLLLMVLFASPSSSSSSSASSSFSDSVFDSHGSTGRNLLQAKKACPVNFEFQNYTIITSQCKGPKYPPKTCCAAFKEFACPFADVLNDLTNNCASTMFSYINLYGKYPPGLFASACRGRKKGLLACNPTHRDSLDACPVNFEFRTIQSSQVNVKGPSTLPKLACDIQGICLPFCGCLE
ncbi:GPI-anchored protein LLG1 [Ricinus communis]|uniref:GPI-anchored protein LLG1 n=1 Tax=Ricinus communis TaxID=3988 RepID=UPI00201ABCFD|nr:GPI-anchored protein LLG1 [Ricinus communis]